MNEIQPEARRTSTVVSRYQFTLRHIALVFFFTALSLPLICRDWPRGLALFIIVLGLLLVGLAIYRRKRLPAITGVALLLTGFAHFVEPVAVGSGRSTHLCRFYVVDAATRTPIPNAKVRIRQTTSHGYPEGVPLIPIPKGEPAVAGATDSVGRVALNFTFRNHSRLGPRTDEYTIYISPYLWVQVDAPGYERALVRLDALLGTTGYDWYELPFPQMQIRLQPVRADP